MVSGKRLPLITGIVVLMATALVAVYAWDKSKSNVVAKGVSAGGVDIGNLDAKAAERKIRKKLGEPLLRPVDVTYKKVSSELDPKEVGLKLGTSSMVDYALEKSNKGGLLGRTWRRITGGEVEHRVPAKVQINDKKLDSWVSSYSGSVDIAPRSAEVSYTATSVSLVPEKNGVRLKRKRLKQKLEDALAGVDGKQKVKASVKVTKPKVTTANLKSGTHAALTVDRKNKTVRLWKNFKLDKSYTVAVGKLGYETPAGLYDIQNKQVNPVWTKPDSEWVPKDERGETVPGGDPENPLKERWMSFSGAAGFHGTDSLGSLGTAASHGCIRMSIPDVKDLYRRVEIGVPVFIG